MVVGEAVAAGIAVEGLHDEEAAADHLHVLAQPEWLGHLDAGLVNGAEHRELLRAAQAGGHSGHRVSAQDPTLGLAGDIGFE
ncbi:hypothetical protein D3C80_1382810 [compost metagenome]